MWCRTYTSAGANASTASCSTSSSKRSNRSGTLGLEAAMSQRSSPPFRADHVGSFLRPPDLLAARERFARGEIGRAALRAVEDSAIAAVVRLQEDVGLQGITDGEFRRTYFHIDFLEQLEGVEARGGLTAHFHSAQGDIDFAPPVLHVTRPVRHRQPIQVADFN